MKIPTTKLGYTMAGLTVLAAMLVPFLLMNAFSKGFTHLGLHVDEVYSGGTKARTVQANGYAIDIHHPVYPHLWQDATPFVQIAWRPAASLPPRVSDTVDLDNDGQPDVRVTFDVPKDPKAHLRAEVEPLNGRYQRAHGIGRESFSRLIVRVDDSILVRVPLAEK
jgi:hypothetical protein